MQACRTSPDLVDQVAGQIIEAIESGEQACLLPGHEVHRSGLQEKIVELCELTGMPAATLFIGKADYLEHLPICLGAYQGAASTDPVRSGDMWNDQTPCFYLGLLSQILISADLVTTFHAAVNSG